MTVPAVDLRQFVDLTLYDRDPGSLVERAVLDAVAKLPGWLPREGLTEMVLIEGLALEVAELVYAINRVPGAVAEGLLRLFDVARDQGAAATATVRFDFIDAAGRAVPAGTRLRVTAAGVAYLFTLDAAVAAAPGDAFVYGVATAAALTDGPNGAPIGTVVDVLDPHYYIETATIQGGPIAGGRLPEDTVAWLARASARLARLTETLLLPDHFVAAALEDPAVARAYVANLYDPAVGPAPGDNPGHVTLAVLGAAGVALDAGAKAALYDTLRLLTADHLELHVVDAAVTAVAVTVTVQGDPGWTADDVEASVAATLEAYLDPDTWPWTASVYRNELIAVVDGAPGVARVVSLTAPAADVALAAVGPLADAGVIDVTVL